MTTQQRLRRIAELNAELSRILCLSPKAAADRLVSRRAKIDQILRARIYQQKMIDDAERGKECIG